MKDLNIPKYIRELSRDERELIVRLRSCSSAERKEIYKIIKRSAEKQQNKSLQSIEKRDKG